MPMEPPTFLEMTTRTYNSNSADKVYRYADWLMRTRQERKRHPLSPEGRCLACGDMKIGHWEWVSEEPE